MDSLVFFPHEVISADTYRGRGVDGKHLFLAGKATRYPNEVYADRIVYCRPPYCSLQIGEECTVHVIEATYENQIIHRLIPQFKIAQVLPKHGPFGAWILRLTHNSDRHLWQPAEVSALLDYFQPGKTFAQFAMDLPQLADKVRKGHGSKLYALKKKGCLHYCNKRRIWKTTVPISELMEIKREDVRDVVQTHISSE